MINTLHVSSLFLLAALFAASLRAQTTSDSGTTPAAQSPSPSAMATVKTGSDTASAGTTGSTTASTGKAITLALVEVTGVSQKIATDATTGTKTDTPLIETPQAISVVSRDELDLRDVRTVAQALRYTAGVSTEYYGDDPRGYDWVNIRGFGAFDSQYLDGLRLFNYELTEAFGLDRIEVLKGPASVLYGQSTPGGLINSISRHPIDDTFGELDAEIGTGGSYETTLDLGGSVNSQDNGLYRLTALFRNNDRDSNGYAVHAQRTYVAPAFTYRISETTTLTLLTSYTQSQSTEGVELAASPADTPTSAYINNKNWDSEVNEIARLGYELEDKVTPDLTLRQNFRVSRYNVEDEYLSNDTYSSATTLDRTAYLWKSASRTLAIDNQADLKLVGDHVEQTLVAGFDFSFASADTLTYDGAAPSLDIDNPDYNAAVARPDTLITDTYQRTTQGGLYAQDQIKLNSRWIALVSGRYDWVSNDTKNRLAGTHAEQGDQAFSSRVGFLYLADNGLSPYASYSTSFYPNSGTDISGHPFSPTEGTQYEIGLKYAPKDSRGSTTLSLYNLTQSNVLTADPANANYYVQTGEVRSRGIELENKFALTPSLDLIVSGFYDDVEITRSNDGTEGNTPMLTPKVSSSAWLDYTFRDGALRGFTVGGGIRYNGSTYGDDANTLKNDGYAVVDVALRYARGSWRYSFNIDNLFDKVLLIGDTYGFYPSPGFSCRAGVAYVW